MLTNLAQCVTHCCSGLARSSATQAAQRDRTKHHFRKGGSMLAALVIGVFAIVAGAGTPAHAERGLEWEPGGMLYKLHDHYDPRRAKRRRGRLPRRSRSYNSHNADGDTDGSDHSHGYDDETRRPTRRKARTRRYRSTRSSLRAAKRRLRTRANRRTRARRRVRVASLGGAGGYPKPKSMPRRSITGGAGVRWAARSSCLNSRLRAAIYHVARNYGRVRVNSTCRSRRHNRRVGGARRSWHLGGNAADIRIWGNVRGAARYLRSVAGGYKHYGGGLFHIDTGPRRSW